MKKVNIAEILKGCPKGMELDCTMYDNIQFDTVQDGNVYPIKIITPEGRISLTKEGCYSLNPHCKCIIFPKGKTTWEGFQRFFKDGDVLAYQNPDYTNPSIYIHKCSQGLNTAFYVALSANGRFMVRGEDGEALHGNDPSARFASEEERQKLFDAIKKNGYKWNFITKTLEKIIEPKFKEGDIITKRGSIENHWIVTSVSSEYYSLKLPVGSESIGVLPVCEQDDYELLPNKFDINTLKPFDRVLTRITTGDVWGNDFFGYYKDRWFHCSGHIATHYCIPFEGNQHLLGTTDDCDDFYKIWE